MLHLKPQVGVVVVAADVAVAVVGVLLPKGGFKRLRTACAQNPVQFLASVQSRHFFPKNYGRRKKTVL